MKSCIMDEEEAIKKGFEWKYYNPYLCKGDLVFFTIVICIVLFSSIFGLFHLTWLFLIINGIIALSFSITWLTEVLSAVRLKDGGKNENKM